MRQQGAEPLAALTVLLPVPGTSHYSAGTALKQLHVSAGIEFPAISLDQLWLVIEGVALAGGARHEELYDPFRFCGVMQTRRLGEQARFVQNTRKCDPAQTATEVPQEVASVHRFNPGREIRWY